MSVVAAAVVGSAVVGAVGASKAAKAQSKASANATDAQLLANRENIEFQQAVFDQTREDNAPWRDIGSQSLQQLQKGIKSGQFDPSKFNFKADEGYQFRLQEGINALDASAASRGRLQSGAQNKAITRYGQGFASNEYGNAFNRHRASEGDKTTKFNQLAALSNVGQIANSANQSAGNAFATNAGNSTLATGNAIAQNEINSGNARASAYNGMATSANQGISNYLTFKGVG